MFCVTTSSGSMPGKRHQKQALTFYFKISKYTFERIRVYCIFLLTKYYIEIYFKMLDEIYFYDFCYEEK